MTVTVVVPQPFFSFIRLGLVENLINQLKTNRTTEVDWKSLNCQNTDGATYFIWFDNHSYILLYAEGYEIKFLERKPYTFKGLREIILKDFSLKNL